MLFKLPSPKSNLRKSGGKKGLLVIQFLFCISHCIKTNTIFFTFRTYYLLLFPSCCRSCQFSTPTSFKNNRSSLTYYTFEPKKFYQIRDSNTCNFLSCLIQLQIAQVVQGRRFIKTSTTTESKPYLFKKKIPVWFKSSLCNSTLPSVEALHAFLIIHQFDNIRIPYIKLKLSRQ